MTNPKETGDKAEDDNKTTAPAESPIETKKDDTKSAKPAKTDEKKADQSNVYFVRGYGNIVGAKSQADAERRASKILEDRRK